MRLVQPSSQKINYLDKGVKDIQRRCNLKIRSPLDNILTSCVKGNNHVNNDIDFNMVEPIEEQKDMF